MTRCSSVVRRELRGFHHFTPLVAPSRGRNENQVSITALARSLAASEAALRPPIGEKCDYQGSTSDLEGSRGPPGDPSFFWFPPSNLS